MVLRKPLTPTHAHGHVLVRKDRRLGLVRISKNASTESKIRLECQNWIAFDAFEGPVVAFLREPVSRFVSGLPETMLRMTHFVIRDTSRKDRVEVPEDVYTELAGVAQEPVGSVIERFLELAEYAYFDAHHEPQHAFFTDRALQLRVDPQLYLTEKFEDGIAQIERRTGVKASPLVRQENKGGAKPQAGRNPVIDLVRKVTRTEVHRHIAHSGILGLRYLGASEPMRLRDLNALANRFAKEVKEFGVPGIVRERVLALYDLDHRLWEEVTARGGDVTASAIWSQLVPQTDRDGPVGA